MMSLRLCGIITGGGDGLCNHLGSKIVHCCIVGVADGLKWRKCSHQLHSDTSLKLLLELSLFVLIKTTWRGVEYVMFESGYRSWVFRGRGFSMNEQFQWML